MDKIIFTFNKFFYDLIKDLKTISPELKKQIKSSYTVKEATTTSNFTVISAGIPNDIVQLLMKLTIDEALVDPFIGNIPLLTVSSTALTFETIIKQSSTPQQQKCVLNYIYIFAMLTHLSTLGDGCDNLLIAALNAVKVIQQGGGGSGEIVDSILDDEVRTLLEKITFIKKDIEVQKETSFIEDSKIGSLAKEIAQDLDLGSLNIDKPEDIFKSGNGNMIGDIVSKVSSRLQQKFENGDIQQDDLMKEAMQFIGGMGSGAGADMFANLMKSMAQGQAQTDTDKTAQRLKKKAGKK